MSGAQINTIAEAGPVRTAIAHASRQTGMDFQYMLAQAKIESALDPDARARTSSAAGLYQFTTDTWLRTLDRHGSKHGLGWASEAISGGRITDKALSGQIMALRYDANASALMAGELANDNRADLMGVLGREPDAAELYLGHFLGSGDARRFLKSLANAPDQSAANLLPRPAASNRAIFYEPSGQARSVREVMDLFRTKVETAKEAGSPPADPGSAPMWAAMSASGAGRVQTASPVAFSAAGSAWQSGARQAFGGQSMAETLRTTFASLSPDGAQRPPAGVEAAYTRLSRLGL